MSKILSQEEVEALLNTNIVDGEGKPSDSVNKSYVKYDFKKKRVLNVDFTDLDYYANKLALDLKGIFSNFFVKNIKVKLSGIKSLTFSEIKEILKFPSGIQFVKIDEKNSTFLIVMDDTTVFAFVELFFGGLSISEKKFEDRPFTIIEQRVIKKIFNESINNLKNRFREFFSSDISLDTFEMNPKHLKVFNDKERLAVFEMDISMDDFGSSMFFLEDIAGKLYFIFQPELFGQKSENEKNIESNDGKELNEKILNAVLDAYFNVSVKLGETTLSIDEIINLKKGDIIILDKTINSKLDVFVEGLKKFTGLHGIYKGIHAVKIINNEQGGKNG